MQYVKNSWNQLNANQFYPVWCRVEKIFRRSLHPKMFLAMDLCAVGPLPSLLVIYIRQETLPTPFRSERKEELGPDFYLEIKVHPGRRRLWILGQCPAQLTKQERLRKAVLSIHICQSSVDASWTYQASLMLHSSKSHLLPERQVAKQKILKSDKLGFEFGLCNY